ncbi:type II toxin-antitoxin system RelE/ParE family toxin [Pantoea dispersa]
MKELRVQSNGRPVRGCFVFDPMRKAIVLLRVIKKAQMKSASLRP